MTSKGLLLRLIWLAIALACVIAAQVGLDKNVEILTEKIVARSYVPPNDVEALSAGIAAHEALAKRAEILRKEWQKCAENMDEIFAQKFCGFNAEKVESESDSELIGRGRHVYREHFVSTQVTPHVTAVRDYIVWGCGVLYAVIALFAVIAFWRWFKDVLVPAIRSGVRRVMAATLSAPNLKALTANRRLRETETDFLTLKNLYENGLISEQMFAEQKEELKKRLVQNEVFHKAERTSRNH